MSIQDSNEASKLYEASQWWLRLRDNPAEEMAEQWLSWSQADPANLDAFDRIESLGLGLRTLDSRERAALLKEFAPVPAHRFSRALPIAAAVLLTLAATLFFLLKPVSTLYTTQRALHQNVTLADGSHVVVGASSSMAVKMRSTERRIQLRDGEAYFEVKRDPARPFVVDAGDVTVTAVGTAFNVRRTGENVAVSVTDGRVRIEQHSGDAIEVNAGERALYEPQGRRFELSAVAPDRALAWRDRRLEFVNEPLEVVIANVNRYADTPLSIADSSAASLTFTGTVLPQNLSSWLVALPKVLPVRIEQTSEEIEIRGIR